jgi:hypothetical protein
MKDLILATSFGYTFEQLYPFLRSLEETGFDGEIAFFVGSTDVRTIHRLRKAGLRLMPFFYPFKRAHKMRNPLHPWWPRLRRFLGDLNNVEKLARWSLPFHNISSLRYLLYYRFLKQRPDAYRFIFLTDLRDVSFQQSPFLRAQAGGLRFFVEEPPLTIGACPNNSRWIREYFGEDVLRELADQPIICSGTTLGDYPSIITYLEQFILTLRQSRSLMRVGVDQGIHNYLANTTLKPLVTLCLNREAEVLTMGLMPRDEVFARNAAGQLMDRAGTPYAVLHQFDRHEALKQEILSRYQYRSGHS